LSQELAVDSDLLSSRFHYSQLGFVLPIPLPSCDVNIVRNFALFVDALLRSVNTACNADRSGGQPMWSKELATKLTPITE